MSVYLIIIALRVLCYPLYEHEIAASYEVFVLKRKDRYVSIQEKKKQTNNNNNNIQEEKC